LIVPPKVICTKVIKVFLKILNTERQKKEKHRLVVYLISQVFCT